MTNRGSINTKDARTKQPDAAAAKATISADSKLSNDDDTKSATAAKSNV